MPSKTREHSQEIHDYIAESSIRYPAAMNDLVEVTAQHERSRMATTPVQGQFLAFLMKSIGATRGIEVGVFTGIGTLWMAEAVGPVGTVIACDVSEEYTSVGREYWQRAGVADRIDLRLAPAADTLKALADAGESETFDFCYIDADKEAYGEYYDLALPLMRRGGIIAFDNMLLGGRVVDKAVEDEPVPTIRALNERLKRDDRVDVSFLPLCDGVYLARKR